MKDILRGYAAKCLRRRVKNPALPHGGNLVPTPKEAEDAVQLALSRLDRRRDTLFNLYRRCLREVMGIVPAANEQSAKDHAAIQQPNTSDCPPQGRRIVRSGKPFSG
jgi:hypothetical protein